MTENKNCLIEYAQNGSDAAFRELVSRYVDLVYSTALRLVGGDMHRAEDVAQTVFIKLSRVARTLPPDVQLGGWLHRDTCFAACTLMRGERRRRAREKLAVEMNALNSETNYSLVAPVLDEAINELDDIDRSAILLRFFEQHDFRSVGNALGSNEDAARMRVNRALEKLEAFLRRRGITTTAASLGAVLSANAVQAAPVGLAVTISTAAVLTGTTIATTATVTATKVIAMTTLQKTLVTATIAVLAGAGIYEARHTSQLRGQVQALQQQNAPSVEQAALAGALSDTTTEVDRLRDANERLNRNSAELLRLRGEVGLLRNQETELARLRQELRQGEKAPHQQPLDPRPESASSGDFPKASWVFAGYATPEAAIRTWAWAMSRGDFQTMLNGLTPDAAKDMEGFLTGQKTDQPIATDIINNMESIPGYKITDSRAISASEVLAAMVITPSNNSDMSKGMTMRLRKVGNEWKIAGPVKEE